MNKGRTRRSTTPITSSIPLRLLGLFLLALAIVIPGCQAVFAGTAGDPALPFRSGMMR
jgi:hypothetical protein